MCNSGVFKEARAALAGTSLGISDTSESLKGFYNHRFQTHEMGKGSKALVFLGIVSA